MQILRLFLEGHSYAEIEALQQTTGVKAHICHVYKKFEIQEGRDNKDELIKLFCKFKRDWVAHKFRYEHDLLRPDEFFHLENVSDNLCLVQGIECFVRGVNCSIPQERPRILQKAIYKFDDAIYADPTDPIARIFRNNAEVYMMESVKPPLKIAVVVAYSQNKYHVEASKSVLQGVADAQIEFNKNGGKDGQLLEIVIVEDTNQPESSKKLAKNLSDWKDILGVIGHHSSEGTQAAIEVYEERSMAMISPTSLSSRLRSNIFFRTIGSTQAIANNYARFITENLESKRIAVFYHQGNEYSQTLMDDFKTAFQDRHGKNILPIFDLSNPDLDISIAIEDIINANIKVALIISSIQTNALSLAIARRNSQLRSERLDLLFSTSLPEKLISEIGGNALDGVFLIRPNLAGEFDYLTAHKNRWNQAANWRSVSSHNATNALIEAIRSSEQTNRQQILNKLQEISLSSERSSQFGLNRSNLDDRDDDRTSYFIYRHNSIDNNP